MNLLSNISLTEEQHKEFIGKLNEWKKEQESELENKIKEKYENRLQEATSTIEQLKEDSSKSRIDEDGNIDFTDEEAEIVKNKLREWGETIQEETEEKLGEKFNEVYTEGEEKLKKKYSDKFIKTLKDIYEEVEINVREKLKESSEFKVFNKIKQEIAPFIVEGEYTDTVNEDINKLKEIITEQKTELDKIKVKNKLDQLISNMPENIREDFISNLGDIKTENELVEAFQRNIKFMKNIKDTVVTELKESFEEKDTTDSEENKLDEEIDSNNEKNKKIVEDISEKSDKTSSKKAKKTETDESTNSKDIDYDILSEDFKREEEKPKNLQRLQELAGIS